ncbi:hypothetical protein [Ruegeria arenilitoris]|uniref:hypothetical protein n=1 Tax=Ruegeria arenilitoris TaxID=1173585 RepID=UPI00147F41E9|nr:hypothetical protein [Ruegeria arenilitoris]
MNNNIAKNAAAISVPAVFFLCVALLTLQQQQNIWFPLDDAYITIGNVDTFLTDRTDLFGNAAPTGATSLVHFLSMALLSLIVDTPVASLTLGFTSAALYAVGLWIFLFSVSSSRIIAASGTVAGISLGFAWFQLMNGLETGMAMAAIVWAFYFRHTQKYLALAILVGAMPFIRPEFYVLSALFFVSIVAVRPIDLRSTTIFFATSAVTYGVLALISFLTLGGILPDTAGAKEVFFADKGEVFFNRLLIALSAVWKNDLVLIFAGLVFAPLLRGGWVALVFFLAVALSAALKLPGALNHNNFRYLYPFLPVAIIGWAAFLAKWKRGDLVFVIATVFSVLIFATRFWPNYADGWRNVGQKRELATNWIAENLPPNSVIGIHDAGYIPWRLSNPSVPTEFKFVDLVGLKSPDAISYHETYSDPTNGAERWRALDEIARVNGVEYLVILDEHYWKNLETEFRFAGWSIDLVFANTGSYQVYRAHAP